MTQNFDVLLHRSALHYNPRADLLQLIYERIAVLTENHPDPSPERRLVIGPNASLDLRGAQRVWLGMSAVVLGIAAALASQGFWPVLPFAGLEMLALALALRVSLRRNAYREVVTISHDRLVVEFGTLRTGASSKVDMPRHWSRVRLEAGARRVDPTRLVLSCSGQRVEIGRCLIDEEREKLFGRIRDLLQAPERGSASAQTVERPRRSSETASETASETVFPGDH